MNDMNQTKNALKDAISKPLEDLAHLEPPAVDASIGAIVDKILADLPARIVEARKIDAAEVVVFEAENGYFEPDKPSAMERAIMDVLEAKLTELLEDSDATVTKRTRNSGFMDGRMFGQVVISLQDIDLRSF